jgi:hypothetical protein
MRAITLASQKGGTGKSTLCIGLAVAAVEDGERVFMVETDRQGTISNWAAPRANPEPVVQPIAHRFQLERALQTLERKGCTLAIIDTPGSDNDFVTDAIRWLTFVSMNNHPHATDNALDQTEHKLPIPPCRTKHWKKPPAADRKRSTHSPRRGPISSSVIYTPTWWAPLSSKQQRAATLRNNPAIGRRKQTAPHARNLAAGKKSKAASPHCELLRLRDHKYFVQAEVHHNILINPL